MCTAATYKTKDFYMGRTLDYEFSYGEQITISPEEMNRRRTVTPEKKPEQIEVEQHIQQEKIEQRRERQLNQRRNQQRRQSPSR